MQLHEAGEQPEEADVAGQPGVEVNQHPLSDLLLKIAQRREDEVRREESFQAERKEFPNAEEESKARFTNLFRPISM